MRGNAAPQQKRLLLLGGSCLGGGFGVLFREALDAACGVDQLLLAGEERVATGADFNAEHVALDRRASLESIPASAVYGHGVIIGMDTGFHGLPFVASGLHGNPAKPGDTAASLGREQFFMIRESSSFTKLGYAGYILDAESGEDLEYEPQDESSKNSDRSGDCSDDDRGDANSGG